jgi:NADPH-dependent curcumin reductase CurA
MTEVNRAWVLVQRPVGDDVESALRFREVPIPEPGEGQVLARTLYLSLDPANRGWMAGDSYISAVPLDGPMWGGVLGRVVRSRSPNFKPGDLIGGFGAWADYSVIAAEGNGSANTVIRPVPGVPLSAIQSLFGAAGNTAYVGVVDICRVKAGDTFVVSGAAGSVGSIAGQIARILGATVIGIAGSPEKCAWLTDELGFDQAIDYRREDVKARLRDLCPHGVDAYFENVGGAVGDAVIANIAQRGRVALCGLVSTYNSDGKIDYPIDLSPIIVKAATMEGFILFNHLDRLEESNAALARWLAEGRIKYHVDLVEGLENAREAFKSLFEMGGSHRGKLLVRVDPTAD